MMKTFKLNLLLVVAMFAVAVSAFAADQIQSMNLANMAVDKVLLLYKQAAVCELIESSDAKKQYQREISLRASGSVDEMLKAMEKAIAEQSGVVLTRLGDGKVSVTFNDAITIRPAKSGNPVLIKR